MGQRTGVCIVRIVSLELIKQSLCSSIAGQLASEAVLKGVGVGNPSATVLAATITWILRDGSGMVGQILFAWMKGSSLDANPGLWRLVADIMNDVAMLVRNSALQCPFVLLSFPIRLNCFLLVFRPCSFILSV